MRIRNYLIASLSFCLLAISPAASSGEGPGYTVLTEPQSTYSGKKVEVIEFFAYACPHCFSFDPTLTAWVKKQGDQIVFKRIPVNFRPEWILHERMYYALEAMGKSEEMHAKIFNALHTEHQRLDNDVVISALMVKLGIDKQEFADAYNSFSVQAKVKRVGQLQAIYKIDEVPLVVVDGRYATSPATAGEMVGHDKPEPELQQVVTKILDDLVAKSKKK
jgi:thiol:disulfide interchange protein DsbA